MKKKLLTLCALLVAICSSAATQDFNSSWRFSLGDFPAATQVKFDDSRWRELSVPHDWAFEGGYSVHAPQKDKGGYGMGGVAWYRKRFSLQEIDKNGSSYFIDFEGVYMNSEVWINGHHLGKRPYGYVSFSYELSQWLVDGENVIAVRVDNLLEPSARWYHGCGIYGNVELRIKNNLHFVKDGTFVQTPSMGGVKIESEISARSTQEIKLCYTVTDSNGRKVAKGASPTVSLGEGVSTLPIEFKVKEPQLWSPDTPTLYTLTLEIKDKKGKKVIDEQQINFGFRTIEWFAQSGFHLNGEQLKLRGVCEHLEGGPMGALSPEAVVRWKLQQIKDMGCNAVRFTHNPFLPIYYEVCDQIGLLVMDEIFDGWKQKADFDYGLQAFDEWWERDLTDWIRRNRNHPSIFLYSVGNETHGDIAPQLVAACHKADPTRMVTSGDCNPDDMDVYGVNGRSEMIESFMDQWDMRKPFVATENPHTWQVRGFYRTQTWYRDGYPNLRQGTQYVPDLTSQEIFSYDWIAPEGRRSKKQVFNSSYDNAFVRVTARHLIQELRDREWFSGSFRWTGFDYRGEAGYVHGGWPFRAFQSGTLDLAGFEKDLYYLYQSQWADIDMAHILPHWTHPMIEEGTQIPVWVYTSGDEAELLLNGESLGRKTRGEKWDKMQLEWLVPWTPGRIEVIAYRNGKQIATATQQSSGAPSQLALYSYQDSPLQPDGQDVAIVTIEQQDAEGTLYPYGENRVYAKIYGAARLLSFENGSPVDIENNYEAESKCNFMGLGRMFIESTANSKSSEPTSVVVASILGDKKLMLSNQVSIDVKEFSLDGTASARKFEIHYTTDGSAPTKSSALYTSPFEIELGTTVRAVVYSADTQLFAMKESFAQDQGLYWGVAGEKVCAFDGLQAEEAILHAASKSKKTGDGYYANGYVLLRGKESSVTFYQENDGVDYNATIHIRYSQQTPSGAATKMELFNNDTSLGIVEMVNTGSETSHWQEVQHPIVIGSGANNIKLIALDDATPTLDQIRIVQ